MKTNQRGFTLIEVMVSLAIFAVAGVAISKFMFDSKKLALEVEGDVNEQLDRIVAERFILKDLRYADISFNNVTTPDDRGREFFTLIDDAVDKNIILNSNREYTLRLGGRPFFLIRSEEKFGSGTFYPPESAYIVGQAPNILAEAPLTYVGLNKDNILRTTANYLTVPNRLVMLDTPIRLRPIENSGEIDFSKPARSSIYVGMSYGSNIDVRALDFDGRLNFSHPSKLGVTNTSVDVFLRKLPAIGGTAAIARIRPIIAVEYVILRQGDSNRADLVRRVYTDGEFKGDFTIATNVERVVFQRSSVRDSMIQFMIVNAE